ncbi:hypothetical protein T484DRAFT_1747598 [Baffinella frigidus]|nr:hypothetical protein T484DRAFT_1747598 [Cryptophyta sp. CCMP2293]
MKNAVNDRPGETDTYQDPHIPHPDCNNGLGLDYDGFETDDIETVRSHFMPEQEIVIEERRNIYTDVYLLGIAAFTATYCIDTVSPAPTTAFISGLLIMSIIQSCNILAILSRSTECKNLGVSGPGSEIHLKRVLTVASCVFATAAFIMFCIGLIGADISENKKNSSVDNIFDVTFSVLLPLISPWFLVTVSPKQKPLQTIFECTPFVFTICFCFVLFFLATRGEMSTILHQFRKTGSYNETDSVYQQLSLLDNATGNALDIEFHSDVNASIHFDLDFFTRTSVDSSGNIPLLLCAPFVKIPTMIVVIANVMNRSNLVVITTLLVIMSSREINNTHMDDNAYRAYCVALGLGTIALVFNVLKYLHPSPWLLYMKKGHGSALEDGRQVEDVKLDVEMDNNL